MAFSPCPSLALSHMFTKLKAYSLGNTHYIVISAREYIQQLWQLIYDTTRTDNHQPVDNETGLSPFPAIPPEQPRKSHPEEPLAPVKMNRLQPFRAIRADKGSQLGGRQHIAFVPLDHNIVDPVQRFHPLRYGLDLNTDTQGACPRETHSQIPNVYNTVCSDCRHSSYFPHAVDDGGKCGTWEYRTWLVTFKRGKTA